VLRSHGFEVSVAASASEALRFLERETPDVIVSDIMMPETDGFMLHHTLRTHPLWCHVPFIFLSALSEPEDVRAARERGCDEYLTKPFDPAELGAIIRGKAMLSKERRTKNQEQFDGYRKRVIHTLSHEFRTPLVAINTGTELLLDNPATRTDEDHFRKLLESIHRGGLRLQRLVEDFMSLQQIETGSAAKVAERLKRKVAVASLAKEALDHHADTSQDPNQLIEFRNEVGEDRIWVEVYDAQVHNIISRLIANAHKFAGSNVPIAVIVRATMDTASIVIRDRGPGLPEGLVNNACELFAQIDRDKLEQQGCGLGLTIASHYAKYNRGRLLFHSPLEGSGLEVELRLSRVS